MNETLVIGGILLILWLMRGKSKVIREYYDTMQGDPSVPLYVNTLDVDIIADLYNTDESLTAKITVRNEYKSDRIWTIKPGENLRVILFPDDFLFGEAYQSTLAPQFYYVITKPE